MTEGLVVKTLPPPGPSLCPWAVSLEVKYRKHKSSQVFKINEETVSYLLINCIHFNALYTLNASFVIQHFNVSASHPFRPCPFTTQLHQFS